MRRMLWLSSLIWIMTSSSVAWAQQGPPDSSLTNFATGAIPPSHIIQPPQASPPVPIPQQVPSPGSSSFSLAKLFSNISFPSLTSLFTSSNGPAPMLPGQHPNAFGPLPPTTTLPTPPANAYNPVLPPTSLPSPQYSNAFTPLPPIIPNQ